MDDVTGLPHLRTVQVVEKIIETEVDCLLCLVMYSTAHECLCVRFCMLNVPYQSPYTYYWSIE